MSSGQGLGTGHTRRGRAGTGPLAATAARPQRAAPTCILRAAASAASPGAQTPQQPPRLPSARGSCRPARAPASCAAPRRPPRSASCPLAAPPASGGTGSRGRPWPPLRAGQRRAAARRASGVRAAGPRALAAARAAPRAGACHRLGRVEPAPVAAPAPPAAAAAPSSSSSSAHKSQGREDERTGVEAHALHQVTQHLGLGLGRLQPPAGHLLAQQAPAEGGRGGWAGGEWRSAAAAVRASSWPPLPHPAANSPAPPAPQSARAAHL